MSEEPESMERRPIGALGAACIVGGFVVGTAMTIELMIRVLALAEPIALAESTIRTHAIFAGLAQALAGSATFLIARRVYFPRVPTLEAIGVRPVRSRAILLALLAGATLQIPLAELGNWVEELVPVSLVEKEAMATLLSPTSFLDGLGLVFAVAFVAPITEEIVFRGVLLPGVARGSGLGIGVVISTLGFAISHGRPGPVVVAFAGGLALAFVTIRARSIVPAIALHAATNAVPVLLPARVLPIDGLNVVSNGPMHVAPGLLVASTLACAIAFALYVRELRDD